MRVESLLLWAALCAVSTGVAAQDVRLADLEKNALRARPALTAAGAKVTEASAGIDVATSAYAPTIGLLGMAELLPGSRYLPYYEAYEPTPGDVAYRDSGYKVSVGAPIQSGLNAFVPVPRYNAVVDIRGNIYDFGRTGAAVDAAVAQRRAAEADANKTTQDIVRDVRSAYVHWATMHALWSICDRAANASQARKRSIEAAIEEGARRTADLITAASEAGFTRLELQRAYANVEAAREDVSFVAAMKLAATARPADDVLAVGALGRNSDRLADPALVALREQHAAARANARVHEHSHAPVLSGNAQLGVSGQNGSVFPLYRLGINVTVPLWDGGANQATRSQAEAKAAQVSAQTSEYTRQREHMRRRAEASQAQATERISIAQELVRLCGMRVAQLEEGYPLGAATAPDVAAARAELQRAETELVLARAARAQAQLGVE